MTIRKKTSTTRLPQTLRDELDQTDPSDHSRAQWRSRPRISRKEARKEERVNRKKNKADFFSAHVAHSKRLAQEELEDAPKPKKIKHQNSAPPAASVVPPRPHLVTAATSDLASKSTEKRTALDKLANKSQQAPPPPNRSPQEQEEDSYIAYLESKLGYSNRGKIKKTVENDGLDDLLEFATSLAGSGRQDEQEMEQINESDSDGGYNSDSCSGSSWRGGTDDWHGIDDTEDLGEDPETNVSGPGESQPVLSESQENRNRYVPPHLRHVRVQNSDDSEALIKLTKQLKGLLNRMSEQNLSTILGSIEELYRDHRRNDVTTTLTNLMIDGIASHSSLLDSYVVLHAAFVSSLHKLMGVEFAANFVQTVVSLYEQHYALLQNTTTKSASEPPPPSDGDAIGKECSNLLVLLSELYNFQVISSILIYDIIRGLLKDELTEYAVELLLKVVRNSGQQLRQDDPSALKEIIQIVQNKIAGKDESLSSRTRFMIETLTNLKNNKLKRNLTQNQGAEAVERMKQFLTSITKTRHVLAHEPLRISLEDLRSAGTKGKWWLVGSAWAGDPLVDRQANAEVAKTVENADPASNLDRLARKQGMNTDIRRSIFVVLMSSDDYVDACERLSQLNLTEMQQREIVRVILHCCGNEKLYNPYYTLVCQHLCRTSHSFKITLQFCLWDFLRDLGETSVGGAELIKTLKDDEGGFDVDKISTSRMRNVAKAYAWWIAKDCITLAILKPVDFTILKAQTQAFLREMLVHIFINSQRAIPTITSNPKDIPITRDRGALEKIFIKATRLKALAMGLGYFMSKTFLDLSAEESSVAKLIEWASDLAKDTLQTGVDIVPDL